MGMRSVGWWRVREACRSSGTDTYKRRSACAQGQPSRSSHEGSPRGSTAMFTRRVLVTSAMLALLSVPAFAQGTPPAQPAKPGPAVTAPAPATPATTGADTAPQDATPKLNADTQAK